MCLLANGAFSDNFISLNGVKEGGILSPFLFNIFIDDLLIELENLHIGCYVGLMYFGSIAYADDVLLLAPSLCALRVMLNCCTVFADYNNVLFNAAKSHCIHFNQKCLPVTQFTVSLQNVPLMWTDTIKHLGHVFTMNNNDAVDILTKKNDFISQTNYFLARFGHLPIMLKCKLFVNFCYSFYGCQLWDLGHNELKHFETVWRKVVRRLWGLPPCTHSIFLPFIMYGKSLFDVIMSRFYNFAVSSLYSNNMHVLCMARNAGCTALSFFGRNLMRLQMSEAEVSVASPHVNLLCELVFCRNGYFHSDLSVIEIECMLRDVCCN